MKSILLTSFLFVQVLLGYSQQQPNKNAKDVAIVDETNSTADAAAATPSFPGGNHAFLKFISKNVKYPATAREAKSQGQVTVRFQVDADGSVKNAMVPQGKGIGNGCDEEAIRVVMLSPKWKPGTKNGTAVPVWYEIPISFALTTVK